MFFQLGYLTENVLRSKLKKPNLPSIWNGLFTLLFKSFLERVTGSDSASKLFYTIIYGLYTRIKLDCGSILCTQLVQSKLSTTRHSESSCAHFWSVILKRALARVQIQVPEDSVLATILIFHTNNFIVSVPMKFDFVGSLLETIFNSVPTDNVVINEYQKKPASV